MARSEGSSQGGLSTIQMQALTSHLEKLYDQKLEEIHERTNQMGNQIVNRQATPNNSRRDEQSNEGGESQFEEEEDNEEEQPRRRKPNQNNHRRHRNIKEEDLGGIKIKVPSFQGKSDLEAYLEWEMRVDQIFSCQSYLKGKKVKLVALEFTNYALVWWDQMQKKRARYGERPVRTWEEMKAIMRSRFVPSYFYGEIYNKLQHLSQGSNIVDDYHKEMEMTMIKANILENQEAIMARFLNGLNCGIANVVEMCQYVKLQEMVYQAIKVEKQLKRRNSLKKNYNSSSFLWKNNSMKEVIVEANPSKNQDIKCFKYLGRGNIVSQCYNKKIVIMKDNGEVETKEKSDNDLMSSLGNDNEELPHDRDLLVVRRVLNMQEKGKDETQRENIFHIRCLVQGKMCSMIIDGGSCTNVASTTLVANLNLQNSKHHKPYKLQWLSDIGEVKVDKQVSISFSIEKYKDEVLCDLFPMEVGHILLGRPWQFDR
ncbi:hypothetical protein CR513_33032, partial [Mucuna pruriens]